MKSILLSILFLLKTFNLCFGQWSAIDTGFTDNSVNSLFNFNGKIYIGGGYHIAPVNTYIAEYDGVSLTSISPSIRGIVNSVTKFNNQLVSLGVFRKFQSTTIPNGTATWNGTNWYNLGNGLTHMGEIIAGCEYNGSLYVGGNFSFIDSISRRCIARWDGIQWHSVGIGLSTGLSDIKCMAVFNGELYIGGYFSSIDTTTSFCIAKFNGTAWNQVGTGLNGDVKCFFVDSITNRLYASGNFNASGVIQLPSNIAYWDGISWNPVGNNLSLYPLTICKYKNEMYAGFSFKPVNLNGDTLRYIARWDGVDWQPLDSGMNTSVTTMVSYMDDLIVGGYFTTAGNVTANRIARWHYSPNSINSLETINSDFLIFPNPTSDNFTLQFNAQPTTGIVQLYNINSKLVLQQNIAPYSQYKHLNITKLPQGIYLCKLNWGNVESSVKVIRE